MNDEIVLVSQQLLGDNSIDGIANDILRIVLSRYHKLSPEEQKIVDKLLSRKRGLKTIILLLLTNYAMKPSEVYRTVKQLNDSITFNAVKKAIQYLKKQGIVYESVSVFYIYYYYHEVLKKVFDGIKLIDVDDIKLFYNDLSQQKGQKGSKRVKKGQLEPKLTKQINIKKVKEKAKQKIGRQLEKTEETILEILTEHYNKTKSLWIDPETFHDSLYNNGSSSSVWRNYTPIEEIYKSIKILASHKIAYMITKRGIIQKIAFYKPFIKEVETEVETIVW